MSQIFEAFRSCSLWGCKGEYWIDIARQIWKLSLYCKFDFQLAPDSLLWLLPGLPSHHNNNLWCCYPQVGRNTVLYKLVVRRNNSLLYSTFLGHFKTKRCFIDHSHNRLRATNHKIRDRKRRTQTIFCVAVQCFCSDFQALRVKIFNKHQS